MSEPTLFLIDANALCYRSFFAIKGLATSYGQATNAVFGFYNTLRKILKDHRPAYMAICFDVGKKTRRTEKFAEYKIHRPPMPDPLVSQIPLIKKMVLAHRLSIFEMEGFEADDVIATIAKKAKEEKLKVVIVSGDKDMYQLLGDQVYVYHSRQDQILDKEDVKKSLGIDPEKIVDFIGLAGDKTDNIPGVLGIGDVTARALINRFGSMDEIFKNIDEIKSVKVRSLLTQQKQQALLSRELAILDDQVPIHFQMENLKVIEPDRQGLFELFKELEFRKIAQEFSGHQEDRMHVQSRELTTNKEMDAFIEKVKTRGRFAFLFSSSDESQEVLFDQMMISVDEGQVYAIAQDKISQLKDVFENEDIVKINHDIKNSLKTLRDKKITLKGKTFDVMLAGYLLAPSQGTFDLASLAWRHAKKTVSEDRNLALETNLLFELYSVLSKELEEKALIKLFDEIEMPLAFVLSAMESEGVKIDEGLLKTLSLECQEKIGTLIKKLTHMAGMEFNLNSPKQLSHVLFERLKLPVIKKTKTGFSTDEGVLSKLAEKHALPALILEYRQLTKLKSTYIDALPKLVDRYTKRIHASFNQTGTETGRLSSNNPNLQNIPVRTELGRKIRKAFIASKDSHEIISADYSQIELRILAHLSGDKNLIKAFEEDQDIHRFTASLIFDVHQGKVTKEMRDTAKRVNFGIIYGMSPFGLAKDLKISQTQAQEFIDKYFLRYPSVRKFMDEKIKEAQDKGFVVTILNRRRYLPEINSDNMAIAQFAQRQAINTPVQGSAADLIKCAMIHIHEEIHSRTLQSKMIITVHDELVFDVLREEKEEMIALIREKMEHPLVLHVPIKVSIKAGHNWLDLKEA
ncbi:MAG: DNA polymerase I [Candidatus Omnitrophota bacterium]